MFSTYQNRGQGLIGHGAQNPDAAACHATICDLDRDPKLLGSCLVYEALFCKIKPSAYMLIFIAYRVNNTQFMCVASHVLIL